MAKILDLIYRVKDSASLPIKKIKGEQDSFNTSLKEGQKIATASIAALTGVAVATGKLIQNYQNYTLEIGNMAHATGVSTEEMSALMEMAGDLGIETSSLTTAFRKMAKEGIDPSIEGLIQVRDKMEAAVDPAQRLQVAQQYLGKAALDLMPIFDQLTNEQLLNYVKTMSDAQVVTQAEYDAAIENKKAIEEWNDAYATITLTIGGFLTKGLLPWLKMASATPVAVAKLIVSLTAWYAKVLNLDQATKDHIANVASQIDESQQLALEIEKGLIPTVDDYIEKLYAIPTSINTNLTISGGGGGNWGGSWGGTGTGTGTGMPGTEGNEVDLSMTSRASSSRTFMADMARVVAEAVERGRA